MVAGADGSQAEAGRKRSCRLLPSVFAPPDFPWSAEGQAGFLFPLPSHTVFLEGARGRRSLASKECLPHIIIYNIPLRAAQAASKAASLLS